jgi:hypothetical protein
MKVLKIFIFLCFGLIIFSCNSNQPTKNKNIPGTDIIFDPTGYYLTNESVKIGNYIFDNLTILTKVQENKDKSVVIERVFTQLQMVGKDSIKRLEFKDFIIKRDKLELSIVDTELGKVSLIGEFKSKNGPINDDVENKTVVLKAKLKVNNNFEKDLDFTWFEGD